MPDIHNIVNILKQIYPEAVCSLEYGGDPWRLLTAVRLSAQCTDERVNTVCRTLFREYPDAASMAEADPEDVGRIIRPCGLHRAKAHDLVGIARAVTEEYGGRVPGTMEELLSLPGVGRKTANLVLGDVFGMPGIVADTHCIRINGRLGFYPEGLKDPVKVENILSRIVPPAEQSAYCHRMVLFGRDTCRARNPLCGECPLSGECGHIAQDC